MVDDYDTLIDKLSSLHILELDSFSPVPDKSEGEAVHVPAPLGGWVMPPGPGEVSNGHILFMFDESTSTDECVDLYCSRWPPSRTPATYCQWLSIDRGTLQRTHQTQIESLRAAFQNYVASGKDVTVDVLDQLACDYNIVSGKWLIFTKGWSVDNLWQKVVKLVLRRGRGCTKVTPNKGSQAYVICVYVEDFTSEDVHVLREDLRSIGVTWRIGFKMDAYTHLGIYSKNEWYIRPNRIHDDD